MLRIGSTNSSRSQRQKTSSLTSLTVRPTIPQEREQAEWYLYYALLVRWNDEKNLYERVGLAKIFKAAFHSESLEPGFAWKKIILG
jgi:hypothetical protein